MLRRRQLIRQMARGKHGGGPPRRSATVKVRSGPGRGTSSVRWLNRQLNDPYVREAQRLGYRSRAAFKLIEIDDRFKLLRPGRKVADLGAAPGGWTQVALARVGRGNVVALDILEMPAIDGATIVQADFLDEEAPRRLREALDGSADVVLSDLSPNAMGHPGTDHLRIVAMAEAVLDFAETVLADGGDLVLKVFQGGSERDLLERLRRGFKTLKHVKPPASRKESPELYVVAIGFKGGARD